MPRWAWVALTLLRFAGVVLAMLPVAFAATLWWWWAHPPEPALTLLAHRGFTASVQREPAPELGPRLERWRIAVTHGDTLRALFRAASPSARAKRTGRPWAVVMLGGIGTGDRAALLLPDSLAVDALALEWPMRSPQGLPWHGFLRRVPAMRHALLHAPAALAHGAAALRRERSPVRVALLGASLGTPVAVAALRLTQAEALVLVDGMADLEALFDSETRRVLPHPWLDAALAPPAASLAARLADPLEPRHHAEAAQRMPVLLVDAEAEQRYPPASVQALHAALPHAERRTHPGAHLRPEDGAQVRAIIQEVDGWLRALPDHSRRQ